MDTGHGDGGLTKCGTVRGMWAIEFGQQVDRLTSIVHKRGEMRGVSWMI